VRHQDDRHQPSASGDHDQRSAPELAAKREAEEVVVDHVHAMLARLDADGNLAYELVESPPLADDWPTYEDFEPGDVSVN
jgi:hypothetical protein